MKRESHRTRFFHCYVILILCYRLHKIYLSSHFNFFLSKYRAFYAEMGQVIQEIYKETCQGLTNSENLLSICIACYILRELLFSIWNNGNIFLRNNKK